MSIKSKLKMGALEAGAIGASALGGTAIELGFNAGVPLFIVIPLGVAGGAIGARELAKELREESEKKHRKLKRVI